MENTNTKGEPPSALAIEDWLVNEVANRLGVNSADINVREPFASYGLDSVEAVGLSGELENWLALCLPETLVWDYPTIESLAAYLAESVRNKRI